MMMQARVRAGLFGLIAAGALVACGGGGGGGAAGGGGPIPGGGATPTPTPSPSATPLTPPGYVAPAGAITLIPAGPSGAMSSGLVASSQDGVFVEQAATTPTEPPTAGGLGLMPLTASETSAVIPGSVQRSSANTSRAAANAQRGSLALRVADDRAFRAADTLRERAPSAASLRETFRTLHAQRAAAASARATRAVKGTVGTQRQFKILTSNIGNSGGCAGGTTSGTYQCNVTITATLEASGVHGNIWVDNASLATPGEYTNVPGEFTAIAQKFDAYYATETGVFGPAFAANAAPVTFTYSAAKPQCDASGNVIPANTYQSTDLSGSNGTSIDVVITDALAGTGEGGYYYVVNEIPQEVWNCAPAPKPVSNNTSMFVMTGNSYLPVQTNLPQFNESYWLNTDVPRSMAHEFQHLLHAHDKVLFPEITQTGGGTFDDAFIDEGCSMLAEDLATDPAPGQHIDTPRYTFSFMLEPSLYSLTSFTAYQPNPTATTANPPYGFYSNTAGSYGQAYLFMRYIYDRFGGGAALNRLYASTASGAGPALAAANGEPFPQLYREFAIAVAAQNSPAATGPYAFSSAVTLRGTVTVPSRRSNAPIRTLIFGGPQSPEQFTANQPVVPSLLLTPGASIPVSVIDGGTMFVPAPNGASGAFISITGGSFPGQQGALVQGALPTPVPASL